MNNTKWDEIFRAFYDEELQPDSRVVSYRTQTVNGFLSPWDTSWTHFGCEAAEYKHIDRLEIQLTEENREFVLELLHRIHVPGDVQGDIVTVFGYPQSEEYL